MAIAAIREFLSVKRFWEREDGAVTVDWVVLTASICGLAMWLFTVITEEHFRAAAVSINSDIQEAYSRD
jgi:hypothetical protein